MQVSEIMTRTIATITEQDTAVMAAQKMRDVDIGALPVKNGKNQLSGIITDRDIVVRGIAEGRDPSETTVGELMTGGAVSCAAEQSVEAAARLMEKEQIRRLIVIDKNNNGVGMLSLADLASKVPGRELAGEAVEEISKPAQPHAA